MINSINSKYILNKIFGNLPKKKTFKIIQNNKKIQNKLELNIYNYIKYYNSIPKIEIELLIANDISLVNKPFINIKEMKSHYHIYFDDKKMKK